MGRSGLAARFSIRTTDEIGFFAAGGIGDFRGDGFCGAGGFAGASLDGGSSTLDAFRDGRGDFLGPIRGGFLTSGTSGSVIFAKVSSFFATSFHETIITLMFSYGQVL